ncbi:transcription factor domain-containing protein [Aspergillus novofumigatus IBT 16806]|uniref:Putative fungal-specific transcription factor n=1 Tax=Aspergillus novofumigatus (strain IBT 16806) TaxID=1392255 RepID=A0A2I1BVY0_ASPN1|nr:putative fungal-specific transcription factor [Aspergillus novofumigatus IBT 16806]PKX89543.1 putative fungal-specific transcription factor [Aspergillus novofumigatus IBT 16806]
MDSSDLTSGPSEIGSLTAHSNEESQFVGSSSGVFFINTVRRAFSKDLDSSKISLPLPEDTLVGSEESHADQSPFTARSPSVSGPSASLSQWQYDSEIAHELGKAPPLDMARELMMVYFKVWHPLFPFLHGPSFLRAMELLYSDSHGTEGHTHVNIPSMSTDHRNACWTTIFQCVFNLASHLRPDLALPPESRIKSPGSMHSLLAILTRRQDLPSLQALLAAQLYLVAKMSLRTASTVGGCILRSMLHAGLHRCPFRYKELSTHDRQLRQRIFWCAYAIDRYLSQALGLPLGIQDSDVDVCAPGTHEIHSPGLHKVRDTSEGSMPRFVTDSPENGAQASNTAAQIELTNPQHPPQHRHSGTIDPSEHEKHQREIAFMSYVESGKLTGRALELFHKSILVRSVRRSSVLILVTDVHKWWNSLPQPPLPPPHPPHQPSLSLPPPSTPEFNSGLQTCIGAARGILSALRAQIDAKQALFWPGFLSAAWMAGLVLAFACQLEQYVWSKGSVEITDCLTFLRVMSADWDTAKHCHRALSLLAENIRQSFTSAQPPRISTSNPNINPSSREEPAIANPPKRRKLSSYDPSGPLPSASASAESIPGQGIGSLNAPESGDVPLELNTMVPTTETDYLGQSDFDLNMADLLQGANFDYLLDMFGQQYPSF